jgi:hypothetical protein
VRDFASHYVKSILLNSERQVNAHLLNVLEQIFIRALSKISDEMVLKTVLDTIRHYVTYLKQVNHASNFTSLHPLVNLKDENDDFFASFLAIKMKQR